MNADYTAYSEHDLTVFDKRIAIVKQEIAFEQKTFGHAYPNGDSPRVRYLLHDLRVLEKQRIEILLLLQSQV